MRQPRLLQDIHTLDLNTKDWLADCPYPEPPHYLDGHTVSVVGTEIILIAGGTYPPDLDPVTDFGQLVQETCIFWTPTLPARKMALLESWNGKCYHFWDIRNTIQAMTFQKITIHPHSLLDAFGTRQQ